ncbi:Rieske (2Fe-2S) protein [Micromonospora sp. CPCC 206061]|uniref:Rieske (2Fe-2S) protein n=1 Tax=Micromonospora sp. CPCC 206061 TaxID=3122410 RepID=UPI002FF17DA0
MHSGGSPSRRAVLAAGAAAALAGCETYGGSQDAPPPAPPAGTAPPPASGGDPAPLAKLSDIPVGGGKIFEERKVVVTQPRTGTVKAFSTTCTHAGCDVTTVSGGTINCPCHGSKYKVADGSVAGGPAPAPLPPVAVAVDGDEIRLS